MSRPDCCLQVYPDNPQARCALCQASIDAHERLDDITTCYERGGQPEWDNNDYSRDFQWLGIDRRTVPMASRENSDREFVGDAGKSVLKEYDGTEWKSGTSYRWSLPGNGDQTDFTTGATRSADVDKIDYEGHIHPNVLALFGDYMHRHRVQRDGKVRASDNWQEGIPVYRYVKSLVRHTFEFWRMWRGTLVQSPDSPIYAPFTINDVLCAILFNTMGLILELNRPSEVTGVTELEGRKLFVTKDMRKRFESIDQPKQPEWKYPTDADRIKLVYYDEQVKAADAEGTVRRT